MMFIRSVGPVLTKQCFPITFDSCLPGYIQKWNWKLILRAHNRYFFKKSNKSSNEQDKIPMVINEQKSKTLSVVKPDSYLFKKPETKNHRARWKYSPMEFIDTTLRETFPLRSIYRADMSQGMAQLYEDLNEQMDLRSFIRTFNMPNNMASWIRVCELHTFLMCAKFRPEEYLGKAAIDYLMLEYFNDVEYHSRRLAPCIDLYEKKNLETFKLRTTYIFMEYDEGLQENDKVLAAALWRRFFSSKYLDFTLVEKLVQYVRVQMTHLQTLKFRDIIFHRLQLFVPLSELSTTKSVALVCKSSKPPQKRKLYSSTLPFINEKTYN